MKEAVYFFSLTEHIVKSNILLLYFSFPSTLLCSDMSWNGCFYTNQRLEKSINLSWMWQVIYKVHGLKINKKAKISGITVTECQVSTNSDAAGFEATRLSPSDFKSGSLTTRTSIHLMRLLNILIYIIYKLFLIRILSDGLYLRHTYLLLSGCLVTHIFLDQNREYGLWRGTFASP